MAAWGYNISGQLGDRSATTRNVPVTVTASGALLGKTVTNIAIGRDHSMALCSDGTLVTWGENNDGQLGIGTTTDSRVPVAVNRSGFDPQERFCAVFAGTNAHNSHALLALPLPVATTVAATGISGNTATLQGSAGGNGSVLRCGERPPAGHHLSFPHPRRKCQRHHRGRGYDLHHAERQRETRLAHP